MPRSSRSRSDFLIWKGKLFYLSFQIWKHNTNISWKRVFIGTAESYFCGVAGLLGTCRICFSECWTPSLWYFQIRHTSVESKKNKQQTQYNRKPAQYRTQRNRLQDDKNGFARILFTFTQTVLEIRMIFWFWHNDFVVHSRREVVISGRLIHPVTQALVCLCFSRFCPSQRQTFSTIRILVWGSNPEMLRLNQMGLGLFMLKNYFCLLWSCLGFWMIWLNLRQWRGLDSQKQRKDLLTVFRWSEFRSSTLDFLSSFADKLCTRFDQSPTAEVYSVKTTSRIKTNDVFAICCKASE